mmetsp:Transcript_125763/g.317004  ORF Transcript_125763/g.317004 Transcript_125763/m.317004 type:complete len:110 (-) Transcript_125763:2-331(-)
MPPLSCRASFVAAGKGSNTCTVVDLNLAMVEDGRIVVIVVVAVIIVVVVATVLEAIDTALVVDLEVAAVVEDRDVVTTAVVVVATSVLSVCALLSSPSSDPLPKTCLPF